eukprot:GEMP01016016.1.p1 GENE.GEMP01016016.1~~GEMP01016016.1.p1  ORF type:complete len:140 (+),score=29.25 GEMP01016016.1:55-420(+)
MSDCASFNAISGVNWEEEIRKYRLGAELRGEIEECEGFFQRATLIGSFEPLFLTQQDAASTTNAHEHRREDRGHRQPNAAGKATPSPARSQRPPPCDGKATTSMKLMDAVPEDVNNNNIIN